MEFKYSEQPDFIKEMLPLFESDILNETFIERFYRDFKCTSDEELRNRIDSAIDFNSHTVDRVVLHPTDDYHELDQLYLKYMALSPNQKLHSDSKAMNLFGMDNKSIYNFVKEHIVRPEQETDTLKHTIDNDTIETSDSVFTNDLPLLTPEELIHKVDENYSCFTEAEAKVIQAWREEYALLGNGIKVQSYDLHNLQRINILRNAIYENNTDAILQCGWIPGIEFNSENRVKACQIVKEKVQIAPIINYNSIEESTKYTKNRRPVSIVLVAGSTPVAKTIRKVQGTFFNHASISLDDDISRIYSYNMRDGFNGFAYETFEKYIKHRVKGIGIYTFLVTDEVYDNLEKSLENFNLYIKKTKYSILNLFTIPLNIPLELDMKFVCSEFVDTLLKSADLNFHDKRSSLVSPKDFIHTTQSNPYIVEVFNDKPENFDAKVVQKRIKKIVNSNHPVVDIKEFNKESITEAKSLPVQFDKDGNLIIKNLKKINFEQEYADSHRLLMQYEKSNSYEPMKFELAKMQFFITLLEKRIFKQGKDKSVDELKVRARFLNDFNKYLKIVMKNEPSFNFTEYFEQTQFNDTLIKIDKDTLKYGFKALKYAIKG